VPLNLWYRGVGRALSQGGEPQLTTRLAAQSGRDGLVVVTEGAHGKKTEEEKRRESESERRKPLRLVVKGG